MMATDAEGEQSIQPYDCQDIIQEKGWSPGKTAWCCLHKGVRCPKAASGRAAPAMSLLADVVAQFDCQAEIDHWQEVWSKKKTTWCCEHEGRGCSSSSAFNCSEGLAHWLDTWSRGKKRWCCRHEGVGCQQEMVTFGKKFGQSTPERPAAGVPMLPLLGLFALASCGIMLSCSRSTLAHEEKLSARSYKLIELSE